MNHAMTTHYNRSPQDIDTTITRTMKRISLSWPILMAVVSALIMLGRMSKQQDTMAMTLDRLDRVIMEHVNSDGHKLTLERTKANTERLEKLERRP